MTEKGTKGFIDSYFDFMADPDGLTREDLLALLTEQGVDVGQLEKKVADVVIKGSSERRLSWLTQARERRAEIEKKLNSKEFSITAISLKNKIKEILEGHYGQNALSYAEAYFRKKEAISQKDLETLLEDLNDLNYLENIGGADS